MNNISMCNFNGNIIDENVLLCKFPIKLYLNENGKPLSPEDRDKELRICLVRTSSIGDVLFITPLLRFIKEQYPKINISVMSAFNELFKNNPYVDTTVSISQPLPKFDRTYFLSYEFFPELHPVEAYAKIVGIRVNDYNLEMFLTDSEIKKGKEILDSITNKSVILLHKEVNWLTRQWSDDHWIKLVKRLKREYKDYDIVSLGANKQSGHVEGTLDLTDKIKDLRILTSVLWHSKFIVCVDSGIMHLGIAVNKPVFSLFSITDPNKRVPDRWLKLASQHGGKTAGIHHKQKPPVEIEPQNIRECAEDFYTLNSLKVFKKIKKITDSWNKNKFNIIIPSYNNYRLTIDCVYSILNRTNDWNYEIIITDDNSKEETTNNLEILNKVARIFKNKENLGFTKNCNTIIERLVKKDLSSKYTILMNNDMTLISKNWLKTFEENLKNKEIGIVGVKLLYPNMTIQHAGMVWSNGMGVHIYKHLGKDFKSANIKREYLSVTGACIGFRNKTWNLTGGFDENYKNSAEDVDLCFRIKTKHNLKIIYEPKIELIHYEGRTYGLEKSFDIENMKILDKNWHDKIYSNDFINYVENQDPNSVMPYYKIEFGSGMYPIPGYLHFEIMEHAPHLDQVCDISKPLNIGSGQVQEILANHVIEHVSWRNLLGLFNEWFRILKKDGSVILRTPNLEFIMNLYLKKQKTPEAKQDERCVLHMYGEISSTMWANIKLFSGQDYPSNFHCACYDFETIYKLGKRAGFSNITRIKLEPIFSPGELQIKMIK